MDEGPQPASKVRLGIAAAGILLAIGLATWIDLSPDQPQVSRAAGVAVLVATLWLTEIIPLAVTALIPLVLLPLLGIADGEQIAREYFQDVIFVYLGGFIVALAMERWNLHRRVALAVLSAFGSSPARVILGFLASTALLSMWISNTAAAMMMVTIALAVAHEAEARLGKVAAWGINRSILLSVAYGATIGGIATPVGTPPNLVFYRVLRDRFPEAPTVSFLQWMLFACPISACVLLAVWLILVRGACASQLGAFLPADSFQAEYRRLGPTRFPEWAVLGTFTAMVVLWVTRAPLDLGGLKLFGWSGWFEHPTFVTDGTISIGLAILLFLIPVRGNESTAVMDWATAARLPWHIVLLFGGGFALSKGFEVSGLSEWLGGQLTGLRVLPLSMFIALMCLGICFMSEFTSNLATTQLVLPILAAIAVRLEVNPLALLIPATVACSWGFMMPVGTPPNAIVFGTGWVKMVEMARVGFVINLIAIAVTVVAASTWARWIWGISDVFPAWAR
jgi:sodium-dependent dicarboxylate transporter 2/3/5